MLMNTETTSLTYDWVSKGLGCWVKVVWTNGVRPCPHLLCALCCARGNCNGVEENCAKNTFCWNCKCAVRKLDQTKRIQFKTFTVGCCRHETCRKPPNRSTRDMGVASCKPSSSSSPIFIMAILDNNMLTVQDKTNLFADFRAIQEYASGRRANWNWSEK